MDLRVFVLSFALFLSELQTVPGQYVDGCPMYGCKPSGTFSFSVSVPRVNATIGWVNDFFLGPIPNGLGCVGNSVSLVCQSNGAGPHDTGYVGVNLDSGSVRWRDLVLRFPSLPVLDDTGELWGSDGFNLMNYDAGGRPLKSNIALDPPMRPLFSMQYVATSLLLLVSETGQISTLTTDGIQLAQLFLNGTVERSNGTFIPTAPPVVNGNRFYLMTEFVPKDSDSENLGLQRLYAIDNYESKSEKIKVAWFANFERENAVRKRIVSPRLHFRPRSLKQTLVEKVRDDVDMQPKLLWDHSAKTVFVSLPPPILRSRSNIAPDTVATFWGIKDLGNDSGLVFRTDRSVSSMAMYEMDIGPPSNAGEQLWVTLSDGKLCAMEKDGNISKVIDLTLVLKTEFTITSKMVITRNREVYEDILIFGIHVPSPTMEFLEIASQFGNDVSSNASKSYVVAYDTPENGDNDVMPVMWMVQTPEGTTVNGQIIGIKGDNSNRKDQLVVFSQIEGQFGKLFSIV